MNRHKSILTLFALVLLAIGCDSKNNNAKTSSPVAESAATPANNVKAQTSHSSISYDDHLVQANILFKEGKLDGALAETQAAQKLDAKRFEAPATAALILHAQNKSTEAKAAIDAARELAPADKQEKVRAIAKLVAETETKPEVVKPSSPATPELSWATKRQLNVLMLIVEEADKAALDVERKKLLAEFLDKSTEFVKENPGQLSVWTLRAVAAIELGQAKTGWEAGQQMTKFGADNSDDAKVQKVMAMLDRKGWLTSEPLVAASEDLSVAAQLKTVSSQAGDEFRLSLQKLSSNFPLLKQKAFGNDKQFTKLTLNNNGSRLDAFRFKNDTSEPRNLVWAFALPCLDMKQIGWYILPAEGTMRGFTNLINVGNYPAAPWTGSASNSTTNCLDTIIQTLLGESLQPGKEYIMWFSFENNLPVELDVTFRLMHATDDLRTSDAIQKAIFGDDYAALLEKGEAKQKQAVSSASKEKPFVNSLGMKFVPVPGTQILTCIWETRVKDFAAFVDVTGYDATEGMNSLGSDAYKWKQRGDTWRSPGFGQNSMHPVCGVSWNDSIKFCDWLTDEERKAGLISSHEYYSLPTHAEWSAMVGSDIYPWGSQWPPPLNAGKDNSDGYKRTAPVGSFNPNQLGIYDLSGNVSEWCNTLCDTSNSASPEKIAVARGSSWSDSEARINSESSHYACREVNLRYDFVGFRCVLVMGGGLR